ncbi:MAG: exodeoxyribonuclease VII large subunit [Pirellulaceae bacterium]|nr:exodeoxyribonuclease VII large subunit [Planctomycetaceae bacterium]
MATHSSWTPGPTTAPPVETVSTLTGRIQGLLNQQFNSVWVSGELSDVSRPRSGHLYFTLKDAEAQIRGVIWRNTAERIPFEMRDGLEVACQGRVDVYPPRGSYQLIVNRMEPLGEGALQLAFRQLRARLERDGLFRPESKKPLPVFPRRVAVITSPTSAAVQDFLQVVRRRWPQGKVLIVPVRVQGVGAADELVDALQQVHQLRHQPDIVVLTRGGGSLEDLWAFNEERLVRAVHAATIPVISAVGHEIDVTLCDLVADVRALTPTEAGERIALSRDQWVQQLAMLKERISQGLAGHCRRSVTRLEGLQKRLSLQHPAQRMARWKDELVRHEQSLEREFDRVLVGCRHQLSKRSEQLEALSPLAVLGRGYSITHDSSGTPIVSANVVSEGDLITTRLHQGELTSRVQSTRPSHEEEQLRGASTTEISTSDEIGPN